MRVLIVDDHEVSREAVRYLLSEVQGHEVVGDVGDGAAALQAAASAAPDMAIVDAKLGDESGFDVVRALLEQRPDLPVLVMSMMDVSGDDVRSSGARGAVAKDELLDVDLASFVD